MFRAHTLWTVFWLGGALAGPSAGQSSDVLLQARALYHAGTLAEEEGAPSCVGLYYQAAVFAYASLTERPAASQHHLAASLYNAALTRCLTTAAEHKALELPGRLWAGDAEGAVAVPIEHTAIVWRPDDVGALIDPATVRLRGESDRPHRRAGLGAAMVALRRDRGNELDRFLTHNHPFPVTVLLVPDLQGWAHPRTGEPPRDRLVVHDPLRSTTTVLPGLGRVVIAADLDAPMNVLRERVETSRLRLLGLLQPDRALSIADLYMLEPFQRGKVPLVLVHGLNSSPLTWDDLIGGLRMTPGFLDHYQIFVFIYPTGMTFLRSAAVLRHSLREVEAMFNRDGSDPAMRQIVLIGHSMGGLIAKLQVSASLGLVWDTIATRPFEQTVMSSESRALVRTVFFFGPNPNVRRVIFIATPHRGATLANSIVGRFTSRLIQRPEDSRHVFAEVVRDNPGLVRRPLRRLPSSVDLLEADHPLLLSMLEMPRAPGVSTHSIIGVGHGVFQEGDGVVPISSARLPGVASELVVPATHKDIHHQPQTLAEVRRILGEHLQSMVTVSAREPLSRSHAVTTLELSAVPGADAQR